MRKTFVIAALFLGVLSGQAQEKVMNILKTDGTTTQTRVAELKQISFLALNPGEEGMLIKTFDGDVAVVLFEANPVVTVSNGVLIVKPSSASAMRFEIANIEEIVFDDNPTAISEAKGFSFVVQDGGALLRNIPDGVTPRVYSIDGRSLPTPPHAGGELRLSRATLGKGIFIVKIGTFSAKIQL